MPKKTTPPPPAPEPERLTTQTARCGCGFQTSAVTVRALAEMSREHRRFQQRVADGTAEVRDVYADLV